MVFGALADTSLLLSIASDGTLGAAGAAHTPEAISVPDTSTGRFVAERHSSYAVSVQQIGGCLRKGGGS
eukprot:1283222-Rhodomonas_salina.1